MTRILLMLTILFTLPACTDKLTANALNGTFEGEFLYRSPEGGSVRSAKTNVSFSDNNYSSLGNANYIPAGGSGTFEIQKENILKFEDKNIWTANFDWLLILNGNYKYQIKNDSLILTRYSEPCANCSTANSLYQYRLKRIN